MNTYCRGISKLKHVVLLILKCDFMQKALLNVTHWTFCTATFFNTKQEAARAWMC